MASILAVPINKDTHIPDGFLNREDIWHPLERIPEDLRILLPLNKFTVLSLLGLKNDQVIQTAINIVSDIPVFIDEVCLLFGEFELVEANIAIRITRVG